MEAFESVGARGRRLEKQLYARLEQYSALSVSIGRRLGRQQVRNALQRHTRSEHANDDSATSAANPPQSQEQSVLQNDILELLRKLNDVCDQVVDCVERATSKKERDKMNRALHRFRAVHHDYSQEFKRTRATLTESLDRAELFSDASRRNVESVRPDTELLLKEKNAIHSSINMADDVIEQAQATHQSLLGQRNVFDRTSNRLQMLSRQFPMVDSMIGQIHRLKQRDMIILACVMAILMLILIVYIVG